MSKIDFKCYKCGGCCIVETDIAEFPFKYKDGKCEKLGDDMKCTIYDKRPQICRIDVHYNKVSNQITQQEYVKHTISACKLLMSQKLGMSKEEIKKIYSVETLPGSKSK